MLLGRDAETARIDALVGGARNGRGGSLLIRGEPGVGKTALLRYAADAANEMQLLTAAGIESESELPYSGLSDLLRPILDLRGALPGAQLAALEAALALGPTVGADRFAVQMGALGLIVTASESRPVLAVVDDMQWLDRASASALFFVGRRVAGTSVALIISARSATTVPGAQRIGELRLDGLDERQSRELLAARAGVVVPERVALHLHRQTAGNPLALSELAALLTRSELEGRAPLPDPLPLGDDLAEAFAASLDLLPHDAGRALVVAAANDRESADLVASALTSLGIPSSALDSAEAAGVLVRESGKLAFRHPLLRSAAYHRASAAQRRAVHRALATVLASVGDRDRYAWHLAASTSAPDEAVADEMERASARARERGSYPAAAAALERAARLTPQVDRASARLVAAADLWERSGVGDRALALTDEAASADARLEARRIHVRGRVAMWRGRPDDARDLLVAAATAIETVAPSDAAAMLIDAGFACQMSGDCGGALEIARKAHALVGGVGGPLAAACDWALSQALALTGDADGALPFARRAIAAAHNLPGDAGQSLLAYMPMVLECCEDHAAARELAALGIARAREFGLMNLLPYSLACLALIEFHGARLTHAYAAASESLALARELGLESQEGFSFLCLAFVESCRGREPSAREAVDQTLMAARRFGAESLVLGAHGALGHLELSLGRLDAAVLALERGVRLKRRQQMRSPIVWPFQPDWVEALVQLGRRDDASRALLEFEEDVERAYSRWGRAAAARCRALLAEDSDAADLFERALALHDASPTPFDRARTELRYGELLRRRRRLADARAHLRTAFEEFERLGARLWTAQATAALAASGERAAPAREPLLAALSPQEVQICLAVAEGATNREVAARFFLSQKTIETHLTNAYRKIGVRSRTELAALLAQSASRVRAPGAAHVT